MLLEAGLRQEDARKGRERLNRAALGETSICRGACGCRSSPARLTWHRACWLACWPRESGSLASRQLRPAHSSGTAAARCAWPWRWRQKLRRCQRPGSELRRTCRPSLLQAWPRPTRRRKRPGRLRRRWRSRERSAWPLSPRRRRRSSRRGSRRSAQRRRVAIRPVERRRASAQLRLSRLRNGRRRRRRRPQILTLTLTPTPTLTLTPTLTITLTLTLALTRALPLPLPLP